MSVISPLPYTIGACTDADFEAVKKHIADMELDDRQLRREEFLVATGPNGLAGFGRVREYVGLSEMCSMGVVPGERSNGLGTELVRALAKKATQPLYLVCIMPGFFEPLGFAVCHSYPAHMQSKLDYCTGSLPVPEPYVVMKQV